MDTTNVENQHQLNDVVRKRVDAMLRESLPQAQAALQRLMNEAQLAEDILAPLGCDPKVNQGLPAIRFEVTTDFRMCMNNMVYSVHDNAVRQICEKLGIPSKYVRDLASSSEMWKSLLAARILNKHIEYTQRSRVLIRTVGDQVRAVLSDSYRRLDSVTLITAFLDVANQNGAVLCDAHMNDTNIWIEVIDPHPISVHTQRNGEVIMYFGARFSTSDYGNGALDIRSFMLNGVCTNGMVRESLMKQVHLGAKLQADLALSEKTYQLDLATSKSAVVDLTNQLFSIEAFAKRQTEIEYAAQYEIDIDKTLRRITKAGGLQKKESEEVQKLLMNNKVEDGLQGEPTIWKLVQAVTAYARQAGPERGRELEEFAGSMLSMEPF